MKKVVITFISIVIIASTVNAKNDKIELTFNNIEIKSIYFTENDEISVSSWDDESVNIESTRRKCYISSEKGSTEIKLFLPIENRYFYKLKNQNKNMVCIFDIDKLLLLEDKEVLIRLENDRFEILGDDDSKIAISEKGIHIIGNEGMVSIDEDGIFLEGDGESEFITGLWGKLLGSVITSTISSVVDEVGENRGIQKLAKEIINDDFNGELVIQAD